MVAITLLTVGFGTGTAYSPPDEKVSSTVREHNRDWLLDRTHERMWSEDTTLELHTAEGIQEVPGDRAREIVLDRLGDRPLPSTEGPGTTAGHPGVLDDQRPIFGDLWVTEFGPGSDECPDPATLPAEQDVYYPAHWNAFLYTGDYGYAVSDIGSGTVFDWTTGGTFAHSYDGPVVYGGISDFFCLSGFWTLNLAFVDGFFAPYDEAGTACHALFAQNTCQTAEDPLPDSWPATIPGAQTTCTDNAPDDQACERPPTYDEACGNLPSDECEQASYIAPEEICSSTFSDTVCGSIFHVT